MQIQVKTAAELPKVKPKENPHPGLVWGFLLIWAFFFFKIFSNIIKMPLLHLRTT